MKQTNRILTPDDFRLNTSPDGQLCLNSFRLSALAETFGTPLYVLDREMLTANAGGFKSNAEKMFGSRARVFYPFKCNAVPAVVFAVKEAGLSTEVMTEFELELALNCGYDPRNIIVNGPCKTGSFLLKCIEYGVHLIIIDNLSELRQLAGLLRSNSIQTNILLRVNPEYIPKGLNKGSATGSANCSFGMIESEILQAIAVIKESPCLHFKGLHFHIGTGIRDPRAFSQTIRSLYRLFGKVKSEGCNVEVLDVGGGFASMTTRELSSLEMAASQALNSYELSFGRQHFYSYEDYLSEIKNAVSDHFGAEMPLMYFEPGRCIASRAQILLLTIHRIKERSGMKWLITDGGLGTITLPTYYEYHEMFLCNAPGRMPAETVTITGPCCFASDLVYRNKTLPSAFEGEVLALMDTGAYFNSLESSFNFCRPATVAVNGNECRVVRTRETFEEMTQRDFLTTYTREENHHEIHNCQK